MNVKFELNIIKKVNIKANGIINAPEIIFNNSEQQIIQKEMTSWERICGTAHWSI